MWFKPVSKMFRKSKPIQNKLAKKTRLLIEALEDRVTPTTITQWSFPGVVAAPDNSPLPTTGTGTAITLGMTNNYTGHTGDTASDDILVTAGTAVPAFSENVWRIRGTPANGWATHAAGAPQYSQGIELDASTVGYSNIQFSFDWYSTTQGIRDLQFQYNANVNNAGGWTNFGGTSPTGTYIATANDWYNAGAGGTPSISISLSGITAVNNDANFGIRLVAAFDSTGHVPDDFASASLTGGQTVIYNNSSGNWRFDNLTFTATQNSNTVTTSNAVTDAPASPQNPGTSVTFTDTITPGSGSVNPTGTVAFFDGNTQIGTTQTVTNGSRHRRHRRHHDQQPRSRRPFPNPAPSTRRPALFCQARLRMSPIPLAIPPLPR